MTDVALNYALLKAKQRAVRNKFPEPVGLRIHRSLSWLGRAEAEDTDDDVRFVLLWIGFNAAYARELTSEDSGERELFRAFFENLVRLDESCRIYRAVWERFAQEIRTLLKNKFVFAPFWNFHNGNNEYSDWERRHTFIEQRMNKALAEQDTATVLSTVFDRLYVLRNQLLHGGATWNSGTNRNQVRDGAKILGWLLPIFIDLMMDNSNEEWGQPFYPVIESR